MSVIALPHPNDVFIPSLEKGRQWWKRSGIAGSVLLHGLFVAGIFGLSQHTDPLPITERTIELVMARPEPVQPAPPKPKVEQPRPEKKVAPPKPVPAQRTAAVAAEPAPPAPQPTESPKAVSATQEISPAPAAPPSPRVITNSGIPSDYVNQIFARINAKASYPRTAKLRGEEGRILYKIKLSQTGELLSHDIKSSGNQVLDDAAIAAIKAAAPYPKLPDLGGSAYVLSGAIVFALN